MFYEVCFNVDPFPRGVILGTVELFECNKIESKESFEANIDCHMNDPDWFKNGMYSWELAKPRTTDPIDFKFKPEQVVWSHA